MTDTPLPEIDREKSFMQNLIAFARAQGMDERDVAETCNVHKDSLTNVHLQNNPYPRQGLMTVEEADAAIRMVAPKMDPAAFRDLTGYPETIDQALANLPISSEVRRHLNLIQVYRENKDYPEFEFGPLYRFNRQQKPRDGHYLRIADCVPPEESRPAAKMHSISTANLSVLEQGRRSVLKTTAFELLKPLGYTADTAGLTKFAEETASMLEIHHERANEFGPALRIHMFPHGAASRRPEEEHDVTYESMSKALHTHSNRLVKLLKREEAPKEQEVHTVLEMFGYPADVEGERAFYAASRGRSIIPGISKSHLPSSGIR